MPVSESSSWMSSSRHGAPLIMYSDSPVRNSVRVIVTSENSIGSNRDVLSIVSDTSARPSAGRSEVPAKMTSSILPPRSARAPCAPSTHATESTMFDLPEPFGPTTTHTPCSKSSVVLSAKDLKPFSVSDRRNTGPPSPAGDGRGDERRTCGRYARSWSSNPEARIADHANALDLDMLDPRPGGPDPAPRDHPLHRRLRALELDLDAAVDAIAGEPVHLLGAGLLPATAAEPHTLHPAGHDDAHAYRL